MTPEQIKAASLKMCDLLPDDPRMAVTVSALNFAHVVVATGCDDESAIEALRRSVKANASRSLVAGRLIESDALTCR